MLPSLNTQEDTTQTIQVSSKKQALAGNAPADINISAQLNAALAHEIRNPITNINLSVEMLRAVLPGDTGKIYLDIIVRSTKRINDVVTKLLQNQQESQIQKEGFLMHELIDEALHVTDDRIRLKKVTVLKDYTREDCRFVLHRSKIKISLVNIILNAIDAMTAGEGRLKLSTRSTPGKYIIEVRDNGCGISKENLEHIFKPFFSSKPNGLGVGLSVTHALLHSDHVGVAVRSTEGKGTCFILTFRKVLIKSES
ncbi:MAG TPA: ATP-binding protein [Chitinophagaceae bacterium]|jgi:signal transduction histidine kinase|nr:ATP-binding protein [Chitinophagaceae bacterium]